MYSLLFVRLNRFNARRNRIKAAYNSKADRKSGKRQSVTWKSVIQLDARFPLLLRSSEWQAVSGDYYGGQRKHCSYQRGPKIVRCVMEPWTVSGRATQVPITGSRQQMKLLAVTSHPCGPKALTQCSYPKWEIRFRSLFIKNSWSHSFARFNLYLSRQETRRQTFWTAWTE